MTHAIPPSVISRVPTTTARFNQGTSLATIDIDVLLKLSATFQFEVRGGLCAINTTAATSTTTTLAATVGWRLVYDLDSQTETKFRFEMCEPREHGRVVTKIQGQYVYGTAISHKVLASGAVELVCDNSDNLYSVKVENKQVVEIEALGASISRSSAMTVWSCSSVSRCQQSACHGDSCERRLLVSVEDAGPSTAPSPSSVLVSSKFEPCEGNTDCSVIKTCIKSDCLIQEPKHGLAPARVPSEEIKMMDLSVTSTQEPPFTAPLDSMHPSGSRFKAHDHVPAASPGSHAGGALPENRAAQAANNATVVAKTQGHATADSCRAAFALSVLAGVMAMAIFCVF